MHLSSDARLPEIAVVTNCSPNHLDWHNGWDGYSGAKQRLLQADQVILNTFDPVVASWARQHSARGRPLASFDELPALRVPGNHNRQNAACAAAAARLAGVDWQSVRDALGDFEGLEHRIEFVGEVLGRHFYNDSKSTSPAATLAAIDAMERPSWLLLGGVSKGTDFGELAARAASRLQGACMFGAARGELEAAFRCQAPQLPLSSEESLEKALAWCHQQSLPGDAILFSPACASFDQYLDYCHRGEAFKKLIANIDAAGIPTS
jgi:UDP-N-acetylmuramoylalanine--D-glutamate ligase